MMNYNDFICHGIFLAQKTAKLIRFLYVYLFNYSFLMSQSGNYF